MKKRKIIRQIFWIFFFFNVLINFSLAVPAVPITDTATYYGVDATAGGACQECPGPTSGYLTYTVSLNKDSYFPGEDMIIGGSVSLARDEAPGYPQMQIQFDDNSRRSIFSFGDFISGDALSSHIHTLTMNALCGGTTCAATLLTYSTPLIRTHWLYGGNDPWTTSITLKAPSQVGKHYLDVDSFALPVASGGIANQFYSTLEGNTKRRIEFNVVTAPLGPSCAASPNPAEVNQQVTLTASGGQANSIYSWNSAPDDGTGITNNGATATVTYSSAGTKTITLIESHPQTGNPKIGTCEWEGSDQVAGVWLWQASCNGQKITDSTENGLITKVTNYLNTYCSITDGKVNWDKGCSASGVCANYNPIENRIAAYQGGSGRNYFSETFYCPGQTAPIIISSTATCSANILTPPSVCVADQIIFRLAQNTNSHVFPWNAFDSVAPIKICYAEIFGELYAGANLHDCSPAGNPNNVVLRMSAATDAKAEKPNGNSAGYTNLCYGDLNCRLIPLTSSCDPAVKERLVAYLSAESNADVSKTAINSGFKLCCKSARASPSISCGDKKKEGSEECDYAAALGSTDNNCGSGKICGTVDPNACKCIAVVKKIKTAIWVDQFERRILKAPLSAKAIMLLGTTENFANNEKVKFETFEIETPDNKKDIGTANVAIDKVSQSGELSNFLQTGAKAGDNYSFVLSSVQGDAEALTSEPIEIVPEEIGIVTNVVFECGEINKNEQNLNQDALKKLCGESQSIINYLKEPETCKDGTEIVKCKWDETKKTCINSVYRTDGSKKGTCEYSVKSTGKCNPNTKMQTIDLNIDYVGGDNVCNDCIAESNVPCGRAVLAMPFFQVWQAVISALLIGMIYFIARRKSKT